jgi:hypothetical protein
MQVREAVAKDGPRRIHSVTGTAWKITVQGKSCENIFNV